MELTFLAISVGNTRTRIGCFDRGTLGTAQSFDNTALDGIDGALKELAGPVLGDEDAPVLMASVNPTAADGVAAKVKAVLQRDILRIERDVKVSIGRQVDEDTVVGEDRLLNAAAAFAATKQACVVVDAGTAVTVDFIDGAGTFHGGAIAPGARLMLDALRHGTEQLPRVEFRPPVSAIGHNTADAMRSAVFHGIRGMVRELVEKYAEQVGSYPMVIATGGDAQVLFKDYDLIERIVPDLTLEGMRVTLAAQLKNDG